MNLENKAHVTYDMLQAFLAAPGQIDIHIHHLQGHFVPFVFFAPPGQEQTGYGPIIEDGNMLAGQDVEELTHELRTKLGDRPRIFQSGGRLAARPGLN